MYSILGERRSVRRRGADIAPTRRASYWNACPQEPDQGPRLHDWCYLELAYL